MSRGDEYESKPTNYYVACLRKWTSSKDSQRKARGQKADIPALTETRQPNLLQHPERPVWLSKFHEGVQMSAKSLTSSPMVMVIQPCGSRPWRDQIHCIKSLSPPSSRDIIHSYQHLHRAIDLTHARSNSVHSSVGRAIFPIWARI